MEIKIEWVFFLLTHIHISNGKIHGYEKNNNTWAQQWKGLDIFCHGEMWGWKKNEWT
jgi:hypothetical protein